MQKLVIATRKSPLAMWQAEFVQGELLKHFPGLDVQLLPMSTRGDKILDTPLAKIGGKGLFIKELEHAMLDGRADIAVHSMKDVPMEFPSGLKLAAICQRDDPFDAFVSNQHSVIGDLPLGATVGTSSLRRSSQLLAHRPDLNLRDLRGNVNTRLAKLDAGEYDAIILAVAGLKRLKMSGRITQSIDSEVCLPAPGQGAVGIETRSGDPVLDNIIAVLNDPVTACRVAAERALNQGLQGGCQVPIAAFAELEIATTEAFTDASPLTLRARVVSVDGSKVIAVKGHAVASDAETLGASLAVELLAKGAKEILAAVYADEASPS